jgi:hypothetical protein
MQIQEFARPYVQFRFHGEVVSFTRRQFEQVKFDAGCCRCGDCLCCRALEYYKEIMQ